ncbi:MAG: DUF4398 domain-containing protein [Treponema sp.]|jgi:hypothetical protein|nr:DUF4398 domain-containing protein [Treponema sp.]
MKLKKAFMMVITFSLLMGACAKPPRVEMDNAIDAVTRAENDADAVLYGGNSLIRARDALKRMQAEANSKRYDAAKTCAAEAVVAADKAVADGRAGAIRAREEATSLVAGLRPAIAETDQGIKAAKTLGLDLDFTALGRDFDAVRLNADQAETALAGNNYQDALDKGSNARAGLSDINQRLSDATLPVSRKK